MTLSGRLRQHQHPGRHAPGPAWLLMADPLDRSSDAARPRDALLVVEELLAEAHRELRVDDLTAVLLRVRLVAGALQDGRQPARPRAVLASASPFSAAARAYLRPIRVTLADEAARIGRGRRDELRGLGAALENLLDDVAARPRGSAIPTGEHPAVASGRSSPASGGAL